MDSLQVAPAVWMMMTYLAGRFILGQYVSLASQADRVMMMGQAVAKRKAKDMGAHLCPHRDRLTSAGWVIAQSPRATRTDGHTSARSRLWGSGEGQLRMAQVQWLQPMDGSKNLQVLLIVQSWLFPSADKVYLPA